MKIRILTLFIMVISGLTVQDIKLSTSALQVAIDKKGRVCSLMDRTGRVEYLPDAHPAPLLTVRRNGVWFSPEAAQYNKRKGIFQIRFADQNIAVIRTLSKSSHLSFELMSITHQETVELVVWGPYPTTLAKVIGETVGVVQGESFSIGIQALNPKTLGGYPWKENDCMPQIDIFEGDFTDLNEEGKRYVLYRVEAARPAEFGSTLQAYTRNRNHERIIENWGHKLYTAPPFDDGGVIGSKIALFGCPVEAALETLGRIEIAEGLPHPTVDGQWGKQARSASAAYMIMGFGEADIEKAVAYTKKAGLRYLYHPDPFRNWGHFDLNAQFPRGWDGLKECVKKAGDQGIMVGVHILSNFITTNDPYVTPVPDDRLARVGSTHLTAGIDETATDIPIESPDFFNQFENNHLRSAVVGREIIRYGKVTEAAPWKLLDCQRGAFGTSAEPHQEGEPIGKLADHGYKVFLTDPELTVETAGTIARLFNETGLRQISFDGLEGNRSTGMGNYGEILFTTAWFNHLNQSIKTHYIADASRTSHYFWHIYTRMNWGEPWYAGFRESQTEYRLKNQKYFQRNLMPGMLGWFRMTAQSSIEDIEWMLARSAAFNAGYGFVSGYSELEANGHTDLILGALGEWEKARMACVFSTEQRRRMEDLKNEFHLEPLNEKCWNLYQIFSYKFSHERKHRQPGEPLNSTFEFDNPAHSQPLQFILTAAGGSADSLVFEIDHYKQMALPLGLNDGETLQFTGSDKLRLFDRNWRMLSEIPLDPAFFTVSEGAHTLIFGAHFKNGETPVLKLELRLAGKAERVGKE